jgi:hypothetical protein
MVSEGSGGEWRDGQTSTPGQVHRAHVRNHLALPVIELYKNVAGKRGDLGIWNENCAFRRGRPRVPRSS